MSHFSSHLCTRTSSSTCHSSGLSSDCILASVRHSASHSKVYVLSIFFVMVMITATLPCSIETYLHYRYRSAYTWHYYARLIRYRQYVAAMLVPTAARILLVSMRLSSQCSPVLELLPPPTLRPRFPPFRFKSIPLWIVHCLIESALTNIIWGVVYCVQTF